MLKFWKSGKVSEEKENFATKHELINSVLKEHFKMPRTLDLYKEFIGKTEIERYKQEDFVIKELVKGTPITQILASLKNKVPEGIFTRTDVEKFIERSDELHDIIGKDNTLLSKRWLKAKTDLTEELAQLAAYTKGLIPKLQDQKDNTNTLRAIVAFQNILMNYALLEGVTKKSTQVNTQVNISYDKIEQIRERANKANFILDVDHDKISTPQESVNQNQTPNNS